MWCKNRKLLGLLSLWNKFPESQQKRNYLISEIQTYFLNEREEELGELATNLLLDFFIEKLGPELYNQGVYDSYRYMSTQVEDLLGIQK